MKAFSIAIVVASDWVVLGLACGSTPSNTCGNPELLCYYEPKCDDNPPPIGCNAGGAGQECRYCGPKTDIPCPPQVDITPIRAYYTPPTKADESSRVGACGFKYMLMMKDTQLALVAVDGNDNPVDGAATWRGNGIVKHFKMSGANGVFDEDVDVQKQCLRVDQQLGLQTNTGFTGKSCTKKNSILHWWTFSQPDIFGETPMCMGAFEDNCKAVIEPESFGKAMGMEDPKVCGAGWSSVLGSQAVTAAVATGSSCDDCRRIHGETFTCSVSRAKEGCTIAPDKASCEMDLGGTWCGAPSAPCSPTPAKVCMNKALYCYYEPNCSDQMEGCKADGVTMQCRYCGPNTNIPCPSSLSTSNSSLLI